MNGLSTFCSKYSETRSRSTEGANGRKDSRRLILALILSFKVGRVGLARIERFPKARGPHSLLPCYQPTTLPAAISCATASTSAPSSSKDCTGNPASPAADRICSSEDLGPQ